MNVSPAPAFAVGLGCLIAYCVYQHDKPPSTVEAPQPKGHMGMAVTAGAATVTFFALLLGVDDKQEPTNAEPRPGVSASP
ncbi:hypothetical protein [Streptomyces sp. NPDC005953]|uniref:hypothetical protein n=1 Tax=Streptomyces sp. NPDC005953 TaxID=3156719 RepID=UPI0033CF344F